MAFYPGFCGARWSRTTDFSIISAGQRAGQAIGIPFDLPVRATTSHQKTARAASFGHALGTALRRGGAPHAGPVVPEEIHIPHLKSASEGGVAETGRWQRPLCRPRVSDAGVAPSPVPTIEPGVCELS